MEKRTPHCKLSVAQALAGSGRVQVTFSALAGSAASGLDFDCVVKLVQALGPADFRKSTTLHADRRSWQDVYHATTEAGVIDLKLALVNEVVIVSFREM